MYDFKKLTEQLLKIYISAESVNDLGLENYFDENISLIGTGKHEIYRNLHEFLDSFKFDVKRRGKIKIDIRNLCQTEPASTIAANSHEETSWESSALKTTYHTNARKSNSN